MPEEMGNVETVVIPSRLKEFFNPDARITQLVEGEYKVKTILKDGIAEGGQEVEMVVLSEAVIDDLRGKFKKDEEVSGWKVKKMIINGGNFIKEDLTLYLLDISAHRDSTQTNEYSNSLEGLFGIQSATYGVISGKDIVMSNGIKTGDNVAAIAHEEGHLQSSPEGKIIDVPAKRLVSMINERKWRNLLISVLNPISYELTGETNELIPPSGEEKQQYVAVLEEERRANMNALRNIEEKRKAGYDPFPNDPDLLRVKKSLTTAFLAYLRVDSALQKALGDEANRITDFN
jgi:hypothetical protein